VKSPHFSSTGHEKRATNPSFIVQVKSTFDPLRVFTVEWTHFLAGSVTLLARLKHQDPKKTIGGPNHQSNQGTCMAQCPSKEKGLKSSKENEKK